MNYIREKLQIGEYNYPFADKVNPLLESQIRETIIQQESQPKEVVGGWLEFTGFHFDRDSKSAQNLSRWVSDIIKRDFHPQTSVSRPLDLKCIELWGIVYNEGDYILSHEHTPSLYSFTYYVNAPKGSSPLVFETSGHKIKAEAGKVVIYESRLIHKVLPNKCKGRCVVVGNFIYNREVGTYGLLSSKGD